jgi:outer membrane biosynthesis protein TonB
VETLKKIVSNQYFPAAAVLTAVVLFWAVGLLGGLSLLNNNQPPLTTLTWMLFVYLAAVLTPLAGILAAVDLVRRWKRNRVAETAGAAGEVQTAQAEFMADEAAAPEPALIQERRAPEPTQRPAQQQPTQRPAHQQPTQPKPAQPTQHKPAQQKPIQKKSDPKKAA